MSDAEQGYNMDAVYGLTHTKTRSIIKDRDYKLTGFVLTKGDGGKCISDQSAVRWFDDPRDFAEMMHDPDKYKRMCNTVREMRDVQGQDGNWNFDPYMHGLYNGIEYALSLIERREPMFRDAPERWLAGACVVESPETEATKPRTFESKEAL